MPDNLYFQQPETEALLVDILFIWAKLNSDISYRQGMHEIVAPVLWVVERDAVNPQTTPREPNDEDEQVLSMFAAENIEHDTFTLFNAIMSVLKPAFEHASAGKASGPANTDVGSRCSRILDVYIADTDPALADHLSELQLVPQVFLLLVSSPSLKPILTHMIDDGYDCSLVESSLLIRLCCCGIACSRLTTPLRPLI